MQLPTAAALVFGCNGPPLSPWVDSVQQGALRVLVSPLDVNSPSQHPRISARGCTYQISYFSPLLQSGFCPSTFHPAFARNLPWLEAKHKRETVELGVKQAFVENLLWNFLALQS